MSRSRRSVWNFGGTLVFTAVTMATGFIATPFLREWLGKERFGAWRVLTDWGAYLTLLEFGLGAALWARLATALDRADGVQIGRLLTAGAWAYLRVAGLFLAAGGVVLFWLQQKLNTPTLGAAEVRLSWLLTLSGALLLPFAVYRFLAETQQKSYLVSLLNTVQGLWTTGFGLVAAWLSFGLVGQSLATVSAQLLTTSLLAWRGWRQYPLRWREPLHRPTWDELQTLNRPAFIYMASLRVGILSDSVVIAGVLGVGAVTPFFLTQRLIALAQGQLLGFANATWAGLANLHATGETGRFRTRTMELTGLVSGLSLVLLVPLAAYSRSFIALWVGTGDYCGAAVVWLAAINAWLGALFYLWGWTLNGTGRIAHWAPWAAVFTAVNLTCSIAATFWVGLSGPLIGTLAGYLLVTSWALPMTLHRVFGWSPREIWHRALGPCLWAIPYALALNWVAARTSPDGWVRIGGEIGASLAVGLVFWWTLGLTRPERTELTLQVRKANPFARG